MTWIEITFFVLLAAVFVFGILLDVGEGHGNGLPCFFLLPLFFVILFGLFPMAIVVANTSETLVKEEQLKILSNIMVDGKMVIITDQVDTVTLTSYAEIININSGKTLVKRFYEKNVYYGPDSSWTKIEIK